MQILSLAVVAVVSMTEAFAPVALSSRRSVDSTLQASDKPLTELCEITKEACDAVQPMLNGKKGTAYIYLMPCTSLSIIIFQHSQHMTKPNYSFRAVLSDQDWNRCCRHGCI
jgi:hypothetical protein